ncbi:MAG: cupredoxin family protein [Vibrio sp.]|uniref:copper-resistant cuproprotein CopI n=1 Tax=Vibrio sp. TaxID=678 RepID=UPI003A87488C
MKKLTLAIALTISSSVAFAAMNNSSSMDPNKMDHSQMDNSKMDHSQMASASMNKGMSMNHDNMMSMDGMSDVGMPAAGSKPNKVIHVMLSDDMKITFKKEVKIEPNDIVQFVVMNTGKINHEFAIGSVTEQIEHREMMESMNGQQMHDSGNSVTVEPGKAKQITWHFHGDNNVEFACNIPGHAEAGMVKSVTL